jgi:putative membrane protein
MLRAPFVTLAMLSAIALVAAPVRAQAVADPARSPDAAFVAKASEAAAVDAELATLAATRAHAQKVKAFAKQVLEAHAALVGELGAMGRTSSIAGAPRPEPPRTDAAPPDAMKIVVSLQSRPPVEFDAAFVAAMIASREAAVALFEAESRDGRDAEIKEWAARQLPALREQLVAVRTLRARPSS